MWIHTVLSNFNDNLKVLDIIIRILAIQYLDNNNFNNFK